MDTYERQATQTVKVNNTDLQVSLFLADRSGAMPDDPKTRELQARLTVELDTDRGIEPLSIADWISEIDGVDATQIKSALVTIRNHLLAKGGLVKR